MGYSVMIIVCVRRARNVYRYLRPFTRALPGLLYARHTTARRSAAAPADTTLLLGKINRRSCFTRSSIYIYDTILRIIL